MSTPFSKIGKLMLNEMSDSRFAIMDTQVAKQLLSDLIVTSASVEFYKCAKCNDYIPYNIYEKTITIVGNGNSLEVQLDETPIDNYSIFVKINDIFIDASLYSYDSLLNKVTISTTINDGNIVLVGFESEGSFTNNLSDREMYIVSLGAFIHYLQQFINSERLLQQELGDFDYKRSSNWQTLNSLLSLNADKRTYLDNLIHVYSYENLESEVFN